MRSVLAIVVGYLLGSVLPAYFLGRARGVDLRTVGDRNAGTTNAYHVLGLGPAIVTGAYDGLKGIAAVLVAWWLGVPAPVAYGAGIAAVIGHRFPFYLGFHGAEGAATTSGLVWFSMGLALWRGWIVWPDAIVLALIGVGLYLIFNRVAAVAVILTVAAFGLLVARGAPTDFLAFLAVVGGYSVYHDVTVVRRQGQFRMSPATRERLLEPRVLMRPAALVFPVLYLFVPKTAILALVGGLAAVFISIDVARLASRRFQGAVSSRTGFFRKNEERAFSSATLFLAGDFLTLLLFPRPVATMAIIFVTLGDLAAKYAGLEHGSTKVFSRTLEGSAAFFSACAIAGFVWSFFVPLTVAQYLLGAAAAALTELLPLRINDNFSVPLVSAAVMVLPGMAGAPGFPSTALRIGTGLAISGAGRRPDDPGRRPSRAHGLLHAETCSSTPSPDPWPPATSSKAPTTGASSSWTRDSSARAASSPTRSVPSADGSTTSSSRS